MSIFSALRSGVSGLVSNASALAAISDNVANVNTVGYKRVQSEFSALLSAQNLNATAYAAGGVTSSVRRFVDEQGSLTQTASSTDLAIAGDGFFIVSDDPLAQDGAGGGLFTRSGSFKLDSQGRLVNSQGYYLLGAPILDGANDPNPTSLAALQPINLSGVGANAEATTTVAINANLDSREEVKTAVYADGDFVAGNITPDVERSVEIIDSLGDPRSLTLGFMRVSASPNQWQVEVYVNPPTDVDVVGTNPQGFVASGVLEFTQDGRVATIPASLSALTVPWSDPTGAVSPQDIALDLNAVTQFAQASSLKSATADGSPPGDLVGITVGDDGTLTAEFSNGQSQSLYLIPIATFLNPNGLKPERGSAYRSTPDSGQFTLNTPGQGGAGTVVSNATEASNVDLGTEFTDLIVVQRAYSASSQIIRTADTLLEELINIPR